MLLPLALVGGLLPAGSPAPANTYYDGRTNTAVDVPRLDGSAGIDGVLDESMWANAAILTGFSQYQPVDGIAAADSTEVLIWYDERAMYFGIRAFEPHGGVNATLADRDRIDSDDNVRILLDTFNDRRRALALGVNPFGVQADGVWTEGAHEDLSPDFVYESHGRLTEWGWQVEIRVPFASLRYQPLSVQTWGINVMRRVQHSGHQQTWTAARRDRASFLAQSGTLEQLRDMRQGLVLDINPVLTARADGARGPDGWDYDAGTPEPGVNVRWGVTSNLTMNGTLNPDFSQVESDAGQLSFDPRQSLFFAEKRPFFLEASENFSTPNQLIYTRRIADPIAAAKFAGKISGTDVGFLSAVEDDGISVSGDNAVFNILRVRRDLGANSTFGIAYTDRVEGSSYNRVAAADTRLVFGGIYAVLAQAGASFTGTSNTSNAWRPIFELNASRRGRRFGFNSVVEGTHDEFRAASGFVGRAGVAHANFRPSLTFYGKQGAFVESLTSTLTLDGTWVWDRFVAGEVPDDQKLHLGGNIALRGGWRAGLTLLLESFRYPEALYTDYWIDTGTDTIPYLGTDRITNYDVLLTLNTPQFSTFSANMFIIAGRDENFFEWAPAWIVLGDAGVTWRPNERLRVNGTYVVQSYRRTSDGSTVGLRQIPRLKLEYQLSRPIFIRLVGEYDAERQDDLRDDSRTGSPVLFCDAGPIACSRANGFERSRFRADWLFSYQPTPGTVLFVGYGSTLGSPLDASFRSLRRTDDGFFVKLSYLLRV
jgi:hypothetical protein